MSRTNKKYVGFERNARSQWKQKRIDGSRKRVIEDDGDAPRASKESLKPVKIAKRLRNKGWEKEDVISHLIRKFNLTAKEAFGCLPFEMRYREDWTNEPL